MTQRRLPYAFFTLPALVLLLTGCPPEGVPIPRDGCLYDGKPRAPGDAFPSTDGCNTCSCSGGEVACTAKACAAQPPAAGSCRRTGCSGQVCSDQDVASDCEWRPEYACYQKAACARQPDGACGFTPTEELQQCLTDASQGCDYDGAHHAPGASFPSTDGCNTCSCGDNGSVGCTKKACPPDPSACRRTGCSGQLCSDQDVASTCEWRPEYACYQEAVCARQPDGACGFTPSPELKACLAGA